MNRLPGTSTHPARRAAAALLLLLLARVPGAAADAPPDEGDPRAEALGVRLRGRLVAPLAAWAPLPTPVAEPLAQAAGRLLLHRRGCSACHGLDLPAYPHPPGPDLDGIGSRTDAAWLDLWLREPTAYLPHSRMPRVLLGDTERRRLVTWLVGLGRPDAARAPMAGGDAYRGGQLFDALACLGCHAGGGSGGQVGPALDRVGWKFDAGWLRDALRHPGPQGLNPQSHPYSLSVRDATDLSAFLVRRFTPPDGPRRPDPAVAPDAGSDAGSDAGAAAAGLAVAMTRGCFQCHRVEALRGPRLRLPLSRGRARGAAGYHEVARGALPPIRLATAQADAVAAALAAPDAADTTGAPPPFWELPVPHQGEPPDLFDADPRLQPAACGRCHGRQLAEWRGSRHAGTFSPGLRAQLVDADPAFVEACLACHAPLGEQVEAALEHGGDPLADGPAGVDCAGCHLRRRRVYGPGAPGRPDRLVADTFDGTQHGGAEAAPGLFADDAFCAPCHQFDADGLALAGKPLQNTWAEWLASPAAADGRTCQDCHMPAGDHRMRGLHDRDFVRDAVEFDTEWRRVDAGRGDLRVTLRNVGAGHALPTYATGALRVKVFLSDAHDGVLESSLRTRVAQRRLAVDGQREWFDTRIPAGGAWEYAERLAIPPEARFVNVLVEVDPDHFYRRFYARLEPAGAVARVLLERARGRISGSPYILFARQLPAEPEFRPDPRPEATPESPPED